MLRTYSSFKLLSSRFLRISKKGYRDVRDTYNYFPDHRYSDAGSKKSPYMEQFTLTEEEKKLNDSLPIEERAFEWKKYMKHVGKLKWTTGQYLGDVEPFPRLKIMMLCNIIMDKLGKLPDSFQYKHLSYEYCKFIMKVVDENESLIDIETKLSETSSCEDIIQQLHGEVILLTHMHDHQPWVEIEKQVEQMDKREFYFQGAAFRDNHPFFTAADKSNKNRKNERPIRPETAYSGSDNKL